MVRRGSAVRLLGEDHADAGVIAVGHRFDAHDVAAQHHLRGTVAPLQPAERHLQGRLQLGSVVELDERSLDAQVAHTMRSVHALLGEQGLTPASVIRAVAYFQRAQDADHWRRHAQLGALPLVATRCDICRPELLFEIEVDAAKSLADGASTRQASSGSRQS